MSILLGMCVAGLFCMMIWVFLLTAAIGNAVNRIIKLEALCADLIKNNEAWCKSITEKANTMKSAVDNMVNNVELQVKTETKSWN